MQVDDFTDELLLKESESTSNDQQKLQSDVAYWQTRVSSWNFSKLTKCIAGFRYDARIRQIESLEKVEEVRGSQ